jgi:OsmC-like protein
MSGTEEGAPRCDGGKRVRFASPPTLHGMASRDRVTAGASRAAMWGVRVRATGPDRATAYARSHRFEVGAPVHFDEAAETISAVEYTLGALAADLVNGFTAMARRRRLPMNAVEAIATVELNNPLTVLAVVGEGGHPGIERVRVKVYVTTDASVDDVRQLWSDALKLSPLARTLHGAADLQVELRIEP